ncbi:MAG: hypothetical protein P8176_06935 [Gammaproteobacteria bacterium]
MKQVIPFPACGGEQDKCGHQYEHVEKLMEKAWASSDLAQRVCLAKQALSIDQSCLDAVTVLAMHASSHDCNDPVASLERAIERERKILDEKGVFETQLGRFWQQPCTRSYLRALGAVARLYRRESRYQHAIETYRWLLALDERDAQGHRYALGTLLIRQGEYAAFHSLDQQYNHEHSVMLLFNRVLVAYIETGRCGASVSLAKRALVFNPKVPQYLQADPARPMPQQEGLGYEVLAWLYAKENRELWWRTPGAIRWLALMA